jgi:tetratricopeptide (TPR) repeat protein/transcriptional regulator with XRE-family HTH domain
MTEDGGESFGGLLRAHRVAAGISQAELAERSGVSIRAISDLERGRTRWPHQDSLHRLADALKLGETASAELIALAERRLGRADESRVLPDPLAHDEELGADPGSERQPVLAEPPVVDGSVVLGVPRQLPGGVRNFVGRSDELKRLSALLDEVVQAGAQTGICVITGTAGVGKTTLAVHWGQLAASRFPGGQLYVNLRGFDPREQPMAQAEAIRGFLDALGVPAEKIPATPDAQAGMYRSLLSRRRMLVVLDNAHDADQVRPLLPGASGSLVLVVSRNQLTSLIATKDARTICLGVFTGVQACDLLKGRLGAERVATDPGSLAELAGLCAYLPLALSIAAARAEVRPGLPLAAATAELRDSRMRLSMLEAGDAATSLRTVFSWSCRQLTEQSARMFRLIGGLPGPDLPVSAAASLADLPVSQAQAALAELTSACLMIEDPTGRFSCHDLLRVYAAEQCEVHETAAEREAATHRLLDHYLHSAHAAARLLYPQRSLLASVTVAPHGPGVIPEEFTSYAEALTWFETERNVLLALVSRAAVDKFDTHAMQIPLVLRTFLHRRGFWQECATAMGIALAAARRLGDSAGQAHAYRLLGSTCIYLGLPEEAKDHLHEAANLYQITGSAIGQADVYTELAHIANRECRQRESLHYSEMALAQYRNAGFQAGEARTLNNIGWSFILLEDFEHALPCLQQAVDLQRQASDWHSLASTLDSIGHAYSRLGQHELAIGYYQRADDLARDIGDLNQRAILLGFLGDAHLAAGDAESARRVWAQALGILRDLGRPDDHEIHEKLADFEPASRRTRSPG